MTIKTLQVRLQFEPGKIIEVGTLSHFGNRSVFQFAGSFLASALPLSPFRLPLVSSLQTYDLRGGMETFGVFEDSLPDGWGRKIIDRHFAQKFRRKPTVLERLACVGTDGMGALTYEPEMEAGETPNSFDLADLAEYSWDFDDNLVADVLPELRRLGGSSGGARPKALIGINDSTNEVVPGLTALPPGFSHWIVKFNTRRDGADAGAREYAYNMAAREAGATVPECRLLKTRAGNFFASKRFDRLPGNKRLHLHSAAGLVHANFRVPGEEYEILFRITDALTRDYAAKRELFRRACLNVLGHNRDDHLKNFAYLMDVKGRWSLSPLFDYTRSDGPNGWHTLSVAGEGENPDARDLLRLAAKVGLDAREADAIIEAVAATLKKHGL